LQANSWIKKKEDAKRLNVCKATDPKLLRNLEIAIQYGHPFLIEDFEYDLDSVFNPVLLKQIYKKGS